MKYVIIGAGRAAISAAEEIKKNDPSADIYLVTQDNDSYYFRAGSRSYSDPNID